MTAQERLEALGDTSAAVAASLRKLGIKGTRGYADACPLAVYLGDGYHVGIRRYWRPSDEFSAALPEAALAFARAFDRGDYPDLENR